MPKSCRKKREKVADFSKAKLKLGKAKKSPSNVVDTSFKTRSIALPTQSISIEKNDTVPTNKRRQTLNEILSLLKHYSAGTRKDAILGARELFQDHPAFLQRSAAPLLSACVRLIADEDVGVRKGILSFFEWIFPRLEKKDLTPHAPLLLLFAASAQTHIFPEIRIDAIRFLDLLLEAIPECVVSGWNGSGSCHGRRILEGYLGLLNAGTNFTGEIETTQAISTTAVVLSSQSRLVVLRSLSSFLNHAVDPQSFRCSGSHAELGRAVAPVPTWFLRPSFANTRQYEQHANLFKVSCGKNLTWNANPEFESFDEDFAYDPRLLCGEPETTWDLNNFSDLFSEIDDVSRPLGDIDIPLIMRLSRTLHPTLTAAFLDGAPVVFSPSTNPTETEVQMFMAAFRIARTLYNAILQSDGLGSDRLAPCEELKTLLDYLTAYFPFTPAHREAKVEQAFQDLNVIYCELVAMLAFVSHQSGTRQGYRGDGLRHPRHKALPSSKSRRSSFALQTDLVQCYVIRLLHGNGGSDMQLPRPLSTAAYMALLPAIWALLNQQGGGVGPSAVLVATLDHALSTGCGSAVKRLSIEFVGRLLLLEKEVGYTGWFSSRDAGGEGREFREWIVHLPRTLWQVGTSCLATTHAILRVLLRLVQRGSWVVGREEICSLQSRLRPFFMVVHPIRGQILGPFTEIPTSASQVRRLALDLCASLVANQGRDETMCDSLCDAVSEAVQGTREEPYWETVMRVMRSS